MMSINTMKDHARIWIYQANRFLTDDERSLINSKGKEFVDSWSSHGALMDASMEIYYNRLLVIAVDETQALASGCGIDKSVKFVREMGDLLGIDFFQRTQVLYKDNNAKLNEKPIHEFWAMRKAGLIDDNTIIIDNTIKTMADLKSSWEVPFSKSWHAEMWSK